MRRRAGVFIHEMVHVAWGARDVYLNEEVWKSATNCGLAESNGAKVGIAGYGSRAAQILAARHPALAVVNADNYRLFCDFYDNDRRT